MQIKVNSNFKKTSIGKIPVDWENMKLEDIISKFIVPMRDKPKKLVGNIPWCRIEDIEGKYLSDTKSGQYVDETTVKDMNLKIHPAGTVICSCSARLGVCAITTTDLITNQTFIGLVPSKKVDKEFLYYVMSFSAERLQKLSSGTTIAYLSRQEFEKFRIPFPPIGEQQKIAIILSTWDKVIELKEKLIEQKKEQKKGLMQKLLTGEVRLPGKDGKINKLKLKGLIKEIKEKNNKNTISNVLSVTNSSGFIHQSEQFGRQIASKDLSNYKIVRKGQFAYNPSRVNVGSIDLLNRFDEGILSPMYVIFETVKEKILSDYLYQFIKSYLFLSQLNGLLEGSVRQSLSFNSLEQVKLFVPEDLNEQKEISEFLSMFDKQLNLLELELEKLQEQKKGLMQLLLTGKVRVQV